MRKILLIEDDRTLVDVLSYNLRREGYDVAAEGDGAGGIEAARRDKPDLILLDVMLPGANGFDVCRMLRTFTIAPILMLTARTQEIDKVVGLEAGADDYVTKPFSLKELMSRIRAALRRTDMARQQTAAQVFKATDLEVDVSRHQATLAGRALELSPREFDLLVFLVRNKGIVFSRSQILDKVWQYEYEGDSKTVDVHIRWLRQKIEPDPSQPRYILTVRGVGYKVAE